jgi:hypothetical protein
MACECVMCQMREETGLSEDALAELMQARIAQQVRDYGWSGMAIIPTPTSLPFTYTYGFGLTRRPDVVVVGISAPEKAHAMIGSLWAMDQPLAAGREYDKVLVGYKVKLIEPSPDVLSEVENSRLFHESHGSDYPWSCLQMVWPDQNGLFPDQDGCESSAQLFINRGESPNIQ